MRSIIAVVLTVMIGVFGMYTKHHFASGETLYASQLNEMDEQISDSETVLRALRTRQPIVDEYYNEPTANKATAGIEWGFMIGRYADVFRWTPELSAVPVSGKYSAKRYRCSSGSVAVGGTDYTLIETKTQTAGKPVEFEHVQSDEFILLSVEGAQTYTIDLVNANNKYAVYTYLSEGRIQTIAHLAMPGMFQYVTAGTVVDAQSFAAEVAAVMDAFSGNMKNVLDPENFAATGYYLDFEDGKTRLDFDNRHMTTRMISVAEHATKVYVRLKDDYSPYFLVVYCYDAEKNYLGHVVRYAIVDDASLDLLSGTAYIHLFSNAPYDMSPPETFCITFEHVDSFDEYATKMRLREEAMPDSYQALKHGTSRWKGKKVVFFGDSRTWYDGKQYISSTKPEWAGKTCIGYQQIVIRNLGIEGVSQGVSGETSAQICERIRAFDFSGYDAVYLSGGANDSMTGVVRGQLMPIGSDFDTSTVFGAWQSAVEYILRNYPSVKILIDTPYTSWTNGDNPFPEATAMVKKQVAELYSIPCLDLYHDSGFNPVNRDHFYADQGFHLHLNDYGNAWIGDKITGYFEQN